MAIGFGNIRCALPLDFLQPSDTATDERYCDILDMLQQAIRRKSPGFIMHQEFIIITVTPVVLFLIELVTNCATAAGRLWISLLQSLFRAQ